MAVTKTASEEKMSNNVQTVAYSMLGIFIFVIHALVYNTNKFLFNIIVSLYVTGYAILILVYVNKNKKTLTPVSFNVLSYASLYTVALQIVLILFTLIMMYYYEAGKGYGKAY
jgi:hypothetical protein